MQKHKYMAKPLVAALCLAVAAMFTASCATTAGSADDVVVKRAQARWDALLAGDIATAYGYLSPGYRSSRSETDYTFDMRTRKVSYTSAEYKDHSCEKDVCTVRMEVGFSVNAPVPGLSKWDSTSILSEKWIKSNSEWWFLPQK